MNKINYTSAKLVRDGISVIVPDEINYRNLQKFLNLNNIAFHTYSLPSKTNRKVVVIRHVPIDTRTEEIPEDLISQGITPIKIIRMVKKGKPMPMLLVITTSQYRKIWDIEMVCGLRVEVEHLQQNCNYVQCHKCQLFGHAHNHCTAPYVCTKCAGLHRPLNALGRRMLKDFSSPTAKQENVT